MVILYILYITGLLITYYAVGFSIAYWRLISKVKKIPSNSFLPIRGFRRGITPTGMMDALFEMFTSKLSIFVIWLGPVPYVITYRAKIIEAILSNSTILEKAYLYKFFEPWLGTGLLLSKGKKWHSRRKLITPAFHFSILETFIGAFAEKSQILVKKLEREIGSESFNIVPYISLCTLDIICETAMGTEMNAQTEGENSEYVKAVLRMTRNISMRMMRPWLYPNFIYNLTSEGRCHKKDIKTVHNVSTSVIQRKRKLYQHHGGKIKVEFDETDGLLGRKRKMAFLDLLLESSENGKKLTDEDIREEVDTFMFEGHDTATSAISFTIKMLAMHQEVQEKVYQELNTIFQGSSRVPNYKDLNEMKYLERVIKETLRLYPSVPLLGRIIRKDTEIGGYIIPAGVTVGIPVLLTHRDPEHFPDPETFNPDNFLPERTALRHPYAYVPFSAGPRNCIGQKFALPELKTVLSYIVRYYKVENVNNQVLIAPDIILRTVDGINIKIKRRSIFSSNQQTKIK